MRYELTKKKMQIKKLVDPVRHITVNKS